jgi:uncharacterized membrane protein YfcA
MLGGLAGFIDSIAGGGGLITVPVFSIVLEAGATAIGTNKIVGMVSTGVALYVYRRGGHVKLTGNWTFAGFVGAGALVGAWCARYVPADAYKWLIAGVTPIVLFIVFRREMWVKQSIREDHSRPRLFWLYGAGLACGFYDGIAGPGGGTAEKPVGLVHFAAARQGQAVRHAVHSFEDLGRFSIRLASVRVALTLLRELI